MDNQKLVRFLNQLLANYFVIYVKLHRYHWYVQGEHFFHLHDQFEEMYRMFANDLDELAERILMIHGRPFATMEKFIKETTLTEANADNTVEEMIDQLIRDYQQMIYEMDEEGMKQALYVHDEPTIDLLIAFKNRLEKYIWMLNAFQEKR